MKVEGPRSARKTQAKQGTKAARGPDGAFARELKDVAPEAKADAAPGAGPVTSVDALIAVQAADDSTDGGSARAQVWGLEMLDRLEDLRLGLLLGSIPQHQLENLMQLVSRQREKGLDSRLSTLLDEIELRVRVELAKYQRDGA